MCVCWLLHSEAVLITLFACLPAVHLHTVCRGQVISGYKTTYESSNLVKLTFFDVEMMHRATLQFEKHNAEDKSISKSFNNLLKKSVKVTDLSR